MLKKWLSSYTRVLNIVKLQWNICVQQPSTYQNNQVAFGGSLWGSHDLLGGWPLTLWKMMEFGSSSDHDSQLHGWITCSKPPTSILWYNLMGKWLAMAKARGAGKTSPALESPAGSFIKTPQKIKNGIPKWLKPIVKIPNVTYTLHGPDIFQGKHLD